MKAKIKALGLPDIRVNASGCLDRCELGCTMVIYPEGVWYTYANENDIDEIIDSHIQRGQRVDRLLLAPDQKDLTESQAMNNRAGNP